MQKSFLPRNLDYIARNFPWSSLVTSAYVICGTYSEDRLLFSCLCLFLKLVSKIIHFPEKYNSTWSFWMMWKMTYEWCTRRHKMKKNRAHAALQLSGSCQPCGLVRARLADLVPYIFNICSDLGNFKSIYMPVKKRCLLSLVFYQNSWQLPPPKKNLHWKISMLGITKATKSMWFCCLFVWFGFLLFGHVLHDFFSW